jgi:replication factor A1
MANRDPEFTKKFFFVSGFVSYLKNDDKTYYLACPDESCKKKVMEESVGWRCENCNKTYPNCVPTYVLTAKIADVSEQVYISFYRNEGTAVMGLSAEKLKEIKDQGDI